MTITLPPITAGVATHISINPNDLPSDLETLTLTLHFQVRAADSDTWEQTPVEPLVQRCGSFDRVRGPTAHQQEADKEQSCHWIEPGVVGEHGLHSYTVPAP